MSPASFLRQIRKQTMPNKSQIDLMGHLGKDAELTYTPARMPLAKFSLAVSNGRDDKKTTSWYAITLWGKQAESLQKYLTKGKCVNVMGEQVLRNYVTKDGKHGTSADVRAEKIFLLGGKDDAAGHAGGNHAQEQSAPQGEENPHGYDQGNEVPF